VRGSSILWYSWHLACLECNWSLRLVHGMSCL
jgi:hypothetical protein